MDEYVVCRKESIGGDVYWTGKFTKDGEPKIAKTQKGAKKFASRSEAYDMAGGYEKLGDWRVQIFVENEISENDDRRMRVKAIRDLMPKKSYVPVDVWTTVSTWREKAERAERAGNKNDAKQYFKLAEEALERGREYAAPHYQRMEDLLDICDAVLVELDEARKAEVRAK